MRSPLRGRKRPFLGTGLVGTGVVVPDQAGNATLLPFDELGGVIGGSTQYMPVFVGGLAVTIGDILIAIPWEAPSV